MSHHIVLETARLLLRKGMAFCIYRFPGEKQIHLAANTQLFDGTAKPNFIIAPFVQSSLAPEIFLHKAEDISTLSARLHSLPDVAIEWGHLPAQTTQDEYFERIAQFLNDMRNGLLEKAILSRVMLIQKPSAFDSFLFFERLCADYPQTFGSLFYYPQEGIWIGATPETLLATHPHKWITMGLAGTQPRSQPPYSWREKELEEHDMVGRHILRVFEQYGSRLILKDGPKTIEAARVAHLTTDFEFSVPEAPVSALLADLHPTPAIGGLPVDKGVDCILQYEGYDRKYYCGYIGECDGDKHARLYINLRNLREGRDKIAVFVGGGITAASDPQEEWNETVQKSLTMMEKIDMFNGLS